MSDRLDIRPFDGLSDAGRAALEPIYTEAVQAAIGELLAEAVRQVVTAEYDRGFADAVALSDRFNHTVRIVDDMEGIDVVKTVERDEQGLVTQVNERRVPRA